MGRGGRIYQVDSLSSFQPVPYIGVYGATKAYVLSFSRALNVELASRGIRVMAVCPGWVRTEFFRRAVVDDSVIPYYNRFYTPEQVVRRALRDMRRGKDVSVCGFPVRMQVLGVKLLPHTAVMNIWCKQQKKD
jgi:short-subunit dehydrogenase